MRRARAAHPPASARARRSPSSPARRYGALTTVEQLKDIAAHGQRLVLCTIHQPSSEIFALFDKVLFLAQGEIIYCGATAELPAACARAGYALPPNHNPSDFLMLKLQTEPIEKLRAIRVANLAALPPDEAPSSGAGHAHAKSAGERTLAALGGGGLCARRAVQGSWPLQLRLLFGRESSNLLRNRGGLLARYLIPVFLNTLYGLIFYQVLFLKLTRSPAACAAADWPCSRSRPNCFCGCVLLFGWRAATRWLTAHHALLCS